MQSTMQLLHQALALNPKQSFWSEQLQTSKHAIAVAKLRGRLSPVIAGNLARLLGEDIQKWVAIAALEAEPESYGKRKILSTLEERATQIKRAMS